MPTTLTQALSPELVFVVLVMAILGVMLELATPGVGLGALVGSGLAVLSLFMLSAMDARPAGLLLALLSAALLTVGLFVRPWLLQSVGVLCLLAAGVFLFGDGGMVHPVVLLPAGAAAAGAAVLLQRLVERTRGAPAYQGQAGTLVGEVGTVRQGGKPGQPLRVQVAGSLWSARAEELLGRDDRVRVTGQEGLELVVARATRVAPGGTAGVDAVPARAGSSTMSDTHPPTPEDTPDEPRPEKEPDGRSPGEATPHATEDDPMEGPAPSG